MLIKELHHRQIVEQRRFTQAALLTKQVRAHHRHRHGGSHGYPSTPPTSVTAHPPKDQRQETAIGSESDAQQRMGGVIQNGPAQHFDHRVRIIEHAEFREHPAIIHLIRRL